MRRTRRGTTRSACPSRVAGGGFVAECKRRGWELRPAVREALRALEAGDAKALVVAKLDRLSGSMLDFPALMATAQKQNWALVALDCAVDTSPPAERRWRTRSPPSGSSSGG